jgi:hypothetical protein
VDYLTGFRQRKKDRRQYGIAMQVWWGIVMVCGDEGVGVSEGLWANEGEWASEGVSEGVSECLRVWGCVCVSCTCPCMCFSGTVMSMVVVTASVLLVVIIVLLLSGFERQEESAWQAS